MSTSLLSTLVIGIITITNAQYDDDCGTTTVTVNGVDLMMGLERDTTNEMVRITLTGPSDQWFGFIIGQGSMSGGYAITGQGSSYELVERKLAKSQNPLGGQTLTSSGTPTATLQAEGVLVLERPYVGPDTDYYDFTDLMTCEVSSISIAAARGTSLTFAQHSNSNRVAGQTYNSQCTCPTPEPTTAQPTAVTEAPTSAEPTTAQPTSADATPEPTTAEPTTAAPTAVTEAPTTSEPTTSAPTMAQEEDTFEICGTAELITGVSVTVERDTTNEMVRIEISGDATKWFGYGFGTAVMTGSYGVVVQGADSDSLGVSQYILDKSNGPGESKTGGTSAVEVTDGIAVGTLKMGYAAGAYDFTDFLTCQVDSIPLIAAVGGDGETVIDYHASRVDDMTLTRSSTCTCTTGSNDASANNIFNGFYVMIAIFIGYIFM